MTLEAQTKEFVERHSRAVTLADGTTIQVRPIAPGDRSLLLEGLERLSQESRWFRFHRPVSRLTDQELRYLTEIDYFDHFAWVAVTTDDPITGIGVARYVRDAAAPEVAEAAIVVADEWQGRGVGTILLELLALSASRRDIRVFRAFVAEGNHRTMQLLAGVGSPHHSADGVRIYELEVPGGGSPIRDTPLYEVLVGAASGDLELEPPPSSI